MFPRRPRPCGAAPLCSRVEFSNGYYDFWRASLGRDEMTFRTRSGQSPEQRMALLQGEIANAEEAERYMNRERRKKYGYRWAMINGSTIGRTLLRDEALVRIALTQEGRDVRPACACEVANWLGGHPQDADNVAEDLNKRWKPLFRRGYQ